MNIYYYYCDCSLFSDRMGAMAARRKGGQPCDRPARLFLFFFSILRVLFLLFVWAVRTYSEHFCDGRREQIRVN